MEAPSDIRRTALRQDVKPWLGAALKHARQTPGMARMVSEWARAIAALFVRLPQEKAGDKRARPRSRFLLPRLWRSRKRHGSAVRKTSKQTALRQDVKPWLGAALKHARQTPGMARMVSEWARAIAALGGNMRQQEDGGKRLVPSVAWSRPSARRADQRERQRRWVVTPAVFRRRWLSRDAPIAGGAPPRAIE